MVGYSRPGDASAQPPSKFRPLLKVQVCRWPYPLDNQAKAQGLLDTFRDQLPAALNVPEWRKRPVHKKPDNGAKPPPTSSSDSDGQATSSVEPSQPSASARTLTTQQGGEPDCWIASFTLGVCIVNGEELPCRIEYWECEDGTGFERHELLGVQASANGSPEAPSDSTADGAAPNPAITRANAPLSDGISGGPSHA